MKEFIQFFGTAFILMALSLLITPQAFAHPDQAWFETPAFMMQKEKVLSSVAVVKNDKVYIHEGYRARGDVDPREGKQWLENISGNKGFEVIDCYKIKAGVYFCKQIKVNAYNQDIGRLGIISGVSEEVRKCKRTNN